MSDLDFLLHDKRHAIRPGQRMPELDAVMKERCTKPLYRGLDKYSAAHIGDVGEGDSFKTNGYWSFSEHESIARGFAKSYGTNVLVRVVGAQGFSLWKYGVDGLKQMRKEDRELYRDIDGKVLLETYDGEREWILPYNTAFHVVKKSVSGGMTMLDVAIGAKASTSVSAAADFIKQLKDAGFRLTKWEGNVVVNFDGIVAKKGDYAGKEIVPSLVVYEDGKLGYRLKAGTKAIAVGTPVTKAGIARQITILADRAKTAGYSKPASLTKQLQQAVDLITAKPVRQNKATLIPEAPKAVFKVEVDRAKHVLKFTSKVGNITATRGKTPGTWELTYDGDVDRALARNAVNVFLDSGGDSDQISVSSGEWLGALRGEFGATLSQFRATNLSFRSGRFGAMIQHVPNESAGVLTKSSVDRKARELGYDVRASVKDSALASIYSRGDAKYTLLVELDGANTMLVLASYEDLKP